MKKIISLIMLVCIVFIMTSLLYANDCESKTLTLEKIEGLENSLDVQKLDIRVGGFSGFQHIQNTGFDGVYWTGEKSLMFDDLSYYKISIKIYTKYNSFWETKGFYLENGLNECIFEYSKNGKKIKIKFTFFVDNPCIETISPTETTTETPLITNTVQDSETPLITESPDISISPEKTEINNDIKKLPKTGVESSSIYIILGFCLILLSLVLLVVFSFRKRR